MSCQSIHHIMTLILHCPLSSQLWKLQLMSQLWFQHHWLMQPFHIALTVKSWMSQWWSWCLLRSLTPLSFPPTTRVVLWGSKQCAPVNMVIMEVVLIAKDMVALLVCNNQQSQDTSIQTNASENRIVSDNLPDLGLPENRQATRIVPVIPLMPQSSNLEQSARVVANAYSMAGALYLPWMSRVLEECPGVGYWLSFTQRLPISYEVGDHLYRLMHWGCLLRDKEDAEGEIMEETIEEEVL